MRRLIVTAVLAAVAAVPARASEPAFMSVTAVEWKFLPSRDAVPAGRVSIELANGGEDAHNLRLRRVGTRNRARAINKVTPGAFRSVTFTLRPGRWRLWCSLPGHDKAGMHTTLRVR